MDSNNPKNSAGKRPAPISIRPPARLSDEFYARAKNSGLSMNAFVMDAVFGNGSTNLVMDKKSLALLLSQEAILVGLYQEVLKRTSDPVAKSLIEQCLDVSDEKRADIVKALGRHS